jgi:DNA primase
MSFDLNDSVISQVRQAADIVDIISQFTPLKAAGRSYKGLCPFHREKTPSFTADRAKGFFYCFGCRAGGDVFKFVQMIERMSFPEAVEYVATRVGIELPKKKSKTQQERGREQQLSILDDAAAAYHQALEWSPNAAETYLQKRGVAPELWRKYGFGFAPDSWDYILTRLGGRHTTDELAQVGLVLPRKTGSGFYDRFRNRLMIPIHTLTGNVAGFGGRSLDESDPKYLNSPESEVFNKSQLLFNLHRAKEQMRKLERAILVEGYFDCIALDAVGVPGVVASMGTALTPAQASLIARFAKRVVISYDGDDAGKSATIRAAPILLASGLAVEVLNVGAGDDPDTFIQKYGLDAFMVRLGEAKDLFTFALDEAVPNPAALTTREKTEKLEILLPLLQATSGIARNDAAQKIADWLRLEFEIVWSRTRARRDAAPQERTYQEPVFTGERQLLRAALHEALAPALASRVRDEYFEDPVCRTIYLAIKDSVLAGETLVFSTIQTHLKGEEEQRQLCEYSAADQSEDFSPERLETILRTMERSYLARRNREIQVQAQEAERNGDEVRLDELLREKQQVSRLLHGLK